MGKDTSKYTVLLLDDDPDVCNKYDEGWPPKASLCCVLSREIY